MDFNFISNSLQGFTEKQTVGESIKEVIKIPQDERNVLTKGKFNHRFPEVGAFLVCTKNKKGCSVRNSKRSAEYVVTNTIALPLFTRAVYRGPIE